MKTNPVKTNTALVDPLHPRPLRPGQVAKRILGSAADAAEFVAHALDDSEDTSVQRGRIAMCGAVGVANEVLRLLLAHAMPLSERVALVYCSEPGEEKGVSGQLSVGNAGPNTGSISGHRGYTGFVIDRALLGDERVQVFDLTTHSYNNPSGAENPGYPNIDFLKGVRYCVFLQMGDCHKKVNPKGRSNIFPTLVRFVQNRNKAFAASATHTSSSSSYSSSNAKSIASYADHPQVMCTFIGLHADVLGAQCTDNAFAILPCVNEAVAKLFYATWFEPSNPAADATEGRDMKAFVADRVWKLPLDVSQPIPFHPGVDRSSGRLLQFPWWVFPVDDNKLMSDAMGMAKVKIVFMSIAKIIDEVGIWGGRLMAEQLVHEMNELIKRENLPATLSAQQEVAFAGWKERYIQLCQKRKDVVLSHNRRNKQNDPHFEFDRIDPIVDRTFFFHLAQRCAVREHCVYVYMRF